MAGPNLIPLLLDGSHTINPSIPVTVTNDDGEYVGTVAGGDASDTTWFQESEGKLNAVLLSGDFDYAVFNVRFDYGSDSGDFQFLALMLYREPGYSSFAAFGNRGGTALTIEYKETIDYVSYVNDIGANISPTGAVDLRVARVGSTITYYYRVTGETEWIPLPHSSLAERVDFGTADLYGGIATYSYLWTVPFQMRASYFGSIADETSGGGGPSGSHEDVVVNFYSSTPATITGKTINQANSGLVAGLLFSDLDGYDSGAPSGISFTLGTNRTPDTNGRAAGADALAQQINAQMAYHSGSGPVTDTFTLPESVISCDLIVYLCTTYTGQDTINVTVNGSLISGFDSSANTTGNVLVFIGVEPDVNGDIDITIENASVGGAYIAINGYRIASIENAGTVIEAAATLAMAKGMQAARNLVIEASAGFAVDSGIAHNAAAVYDAQVILNTAGELAAVAQGNLQASCEMSAALGLSSSYGAIVEAAAALNLNAVATATALSDLVAQAALTIHTSIQGSGSAILESGVSLHVGQHITALAGSTVEATAAMMLAHVIDAGVDISIEGIASFSISQSITAAVVAQLGATAGFEITSGLIAQTSAVLLAQAQLNLGADIHASASRTIEGFGTLSVTTSASADGQVTVMVQVTTVKDGRRVVIQAQQRTVSIAALTRSTILK